MSTDHATCPACGSPHIASRRALFHQLMDGAAFGDAFGWYDEKAHHAVPPKSLFIVLSLLLLGLAVPAAGFWFLQHYPALQLLGSVAGILFVCLLTDVLLTYRRYKTWAGEWLCGDCQKVFAII